jgi:hypothetical protein
MFCQYIQNIVGPADERFPHEAGSCVVEYPYSFQPVGEMTDRAFIFYLLRLPWARMQLDLLANSYPPFSSRRACASLALLIKSSRNLLFRLSLGLEQAAAQRLDS